MRKKVEAGKEGFRAFEKNLTNVEGVVGGCAKMEKVKVWVTCRIMR